MVFVFLVVVAGFSSLGLFLLMEKGRKEVKAGAKVSRFTAQSDSVLTLQSSNDLIDYDIYIMSKREWLFNFCLATGFLFLVAYIFYRSILLSVLVIPLAFFYPRLKTKEIIRKRKQELSLQFKEALYALSSSLMVGRSVESAFKESLKDLALLYPDSQMYIIQEFTYIVRRLEMNETIEEVLADFAQRAHLEDVDSFVDVFVISKRTGGNIVEIIRNTSAIIGDKLQIKQEIETLLAQRKLEQKILNMMPLAMILLLTWTTGDYMEPVFTTLEGRLIMTVAVFLLGLASYLSQKIMSIEV
ncbi:MAG: type II secretion system F family protein [Clostridia bacterium]|mgnify:CR=1 FL=1|jgi:tight adherence protein B|nr:type II secretion system F family protein [Clostridia bacterium]